MLDLEDESDRNMVLFYRSELIQISRGLKVHRTTIKLLMQKGLITIQDKRQSKYKLSDLAQKLLEEAEES